MSTPFPAQLNLTYTARWWGFTSSVREFVAAFCREVSHEADFAERVSMTAHELIENAVKYAQTPDSPIHFAIAAGEQGVHLRISNQGQREHIAVLESEMAYVHEGDPLEVYILKLQSDIYCDTSRLGLARIRYEADARLNLAVQDDLVIMEASFATPERPQTHAETAQPSYH